MQDTGSFYADQMKRAQSMKSYEITKQEQLLQGKLSENKVLDQLIESKKIRSGSSRLIIGNQPMIIYTFSSSSRKQKKLQKQQSLALTGDTDLQISSQNENSPNQESISQKNYANNSNDRKIINNDSINPNKKNLQFNQMLQLNFPNIQILKKDQLKFLSWIRENIIGFNTTYTSAIGLEIESVYVDHTATNRPFKLVEVLVEHAKLFAANPHTQYSRYGKFSTQLMHYARDSLLKSFSAPQNQYVVLPTGAGSTGAIQKTIRFLQRISDQNQNWKNPTIFLTPYQHNSNILPWIQFYGKIQDLAHNIVGTLDLPKITQQLTQCSSKNIIVSVSAASNVTSKLTNLKQLNDIIKYVRQTTNKSIVFCVDCAAFCCHHDLNLSIYDQIDFAFLSPHKNLGGAQSCGILLGRKSLMKNARPTFPGGGTVRSVKGYIKDELIYEVDVFSKQIAGTPPYLGFYRAALSFQLLKNVIGYDFIHERQRRNTHMFFQKINAVNAQMKAEGIDTYINLYGERDLSKRGNIMTFNYVYEGCKYILHRFAALVLTDIFGIQVRSGCFCAGPYVVLLLQMNQQLMENNNDQSDLIQPGYLRLDLTFYLEDYEIQYIINAIQLVARYWRNLQKLYSVCNDEEVALLPIFNKYRKADIFSLHQAEDAYSKLKKENANHMNRIENRRKTLQQQLKIGQYICKKPQQFLINVKEQKKLSLQGNKQKNYENSVKLSHQDLQVLLDQEKFLKFELLLKSRDSFLSLVS